MISSKSTSTVLFSTLLSLLLHSQQTTALPTFTFNGPGILPVIVPGTTETSIKVGTSLTQFGEQLSYNGGMPAAITAALNSICDSTGCDDSTPATIPNINFGVAGTDSIQTGTLTLTVSNSDYTNINQRDGMIALVAQAFNTTASANCADVTFQQGCRAGKRTVGTGGDGLQPQDCETKTVTNCQGPQFVGAEITVPITTTDPTKPFAQSITATLDVTASFDGSVQSFDCDSFIDLLTEALDPIPEAEAFTDVLGKVSPVCEAFGGSS